MFYDNVLQNNLEVKAEKKKRQWKLHGKNTSNFEAFARSIIPKQIPTIYLEGYNILNKKIFLLPWPSRPKIIFTSNSYRSNDLFKLYSAKKTEDGASLVIGQHGGGIGTHLFAFYEKHQFDICDLYLSWGWSDNSKPHIKPIGIFLEKKKFKINCESKTSIALIALRQNRQINHIYSSAIASQLLDYFDDQCKFIDNLDDQIKNNLILRLPLIKENYSPSAERYMTRFSDISIDNGSLDINKLFKKCKLCVSTYNSTAFLQSIAMNIPTIIFWNPNHWELKEPAKTHFNRLKEVGVFHETPESAARYINMIWQDIDSWWNNEAVKKTIIEFKNYYCRSPDNLVDQIYLQLKNLIEK